MKICVGVNFEMSLNLCILATIIITSTIFIKKIIKIAKYGLTLYFLRILVCCVIRRKVVVIGKYKSHLVKKISICFLEMASVQKINITLLHEILSKKPQFIQYLHMVIIYNLFYSHIYNPKSHDYSLLDSTTLQEIQNISRILLLRIFRNKKNYHYCVCQT